MRFNNGAAKSGWLVGAAVFALLCCRTGIAADDTSKQSYTEAVPGTLIKFDMVRIPGGEIEIKGASGSDTSTKVKIKPMWFGKAEVTWDEYDVYVFKLDETSNTDGSQSAKDAVSRPSKPYGAADRGFGHKGYPVIDESFVGARQYCRWLSKKTGHTYRLPTEAEWEYACRAGQAAPSAKQLASVAWFWQEKTHPVAKKLPNAWGLYDMLGNVAEWATDLNEKSVVCGGSWQDVAEDVKPSARKYQDDSWRANDPQNPKSLWWLSDGTFVGFRVVRVDEE